MKAKKSARKPGAKRATKDLTPKADPKGGFTSAEHAEITPTPKPNYRSRPGPWGVS
jgi:hypothetical protein